MLGLKLRCRRKIWQEVLGIKETKTNNKLMGKDHLRQILFMQRDMSLEQHTKMRHYGGTIC